MKGRESGMPESDYWDSFFDPGCILKQLDLGASPADVVEFGCGYGTFTIPAARVVRGQVFALDIEQDMVQETARRAVADGLENVVAVKRDVVTDGCGRPDESAGYAMLFNILHIEAPISLLKEVRRVLVPGGKVGVLHWRTDIPTPRGPSADIRPTPEECRAWGEEAGLEFVRYETLPCCSWHWGLVMRRRLSE